MSFYLVPDGKTPVNWTIPVCKIKRLNLSIPSKMLFATEPFFSPLFGMCTAKIYDVTVDGCIITNHSVLKGEDEPVTIPASWICACIGSNKRHDGHLVHENAEVHRIAPCNVEGREPLHL